MPAILAVVVLAATLIYHYGHGYTPLALGADRPWPAVTAHDRVGAALARHVEPAASLAALTYLNPHASQRQQLWMIDRVENGRPAPLHDADYVWLDVTNGWPLHPNDLKAGAEALLAGEYGVAQAGDGYLLLARGAQAKSLPDAFYDFARAADPRPQYRTQLQFALDGRPVLELLGFDLAWLPDGVQATFYWRALAPLPPGLRLYPFYVDDATGQIIEDTAARPLIAALWYPPERWRAGEVIQTATLPWPVGPEFSLAAGVVQGGDWRDAARRLPIRVESSDLAIRLFDGDTWARLVHVRDARPLEERRVFSPPAPQHALAADFGPVRLLGYDLRRTRERAAGSTQSRSAVRVTLYWQAVERMDTGYTVFVQLLDEQGRMRAQVDSAPRGGGYPTFWWLPGEIVADAVSVEIPADLDGAYRIIAGLYDPATGGRLRVAGSGADFVELK